jgi:hypothetical protein
MLADTWDDVYRANWCKNINSSSLLQDPQKLTYVFYAAGGKMPGLPLSKWEKRCEEWMNLTSFIARCIKARVIDDDKILDVDEYPSRDIPEGLETEFYPGITRDSKVMVAAQYILIAGDFIGGKSWGIDRWQLWARKLEELAGKELASEVKTAVIEARKKLIFLHPELFLISEGGSKA